MIRKAYLAIKFHNNCSNRGLIENISQMLKVCGFQTVCMTRDYEQWGEVKVSPQELMQKSFQEINSSEFIVIELTEKGVGLGIEAGYAYAQKKPIIVIAQKGADISATLKGIASTIQEYTSINELKGVFKKITL